jgi:16S rRNA processing protein RimM
LGLLKWFCIAFFLKLVSNLIGKRNACAATFHGSTGFIIFNLKQIKTANILSDYIHIGKLVATHGLKGELILKHALGKKTDFKTAEAIFIEKIKDEYLPYFHQGSIIKNDTETIVKLEGVDTKESAAKLVQKKVWLIKNDFDKLVSKVAPVNLLGFIVFNNKEKLAAVEAVIEQPLQILLQITINNKEVLIPLNEETLRKIDRKKKEIHVVLPEGLLDIYLGEGNL